MTAVLETIRSEASCGVTSHVVSENLTRPLHLDQIYLNADIFELSACLCSGEVSPERFCLFSHCLIARRCEKFLFAIHVHTCLETFIFVLFASIF